MGSRQARSGKVTVLATGAIERPLPFANNDLPGIRSADAALRYLRLHAVLPGRKIVVATNNDGAYEVADAGSAVTLVDCRVATTVEARRDVEVILGRRIEAARGRKAVAGAVLDDGRVIEADGILASAGWSPTIHLFCQARGKLDWSEPLLAFLPGRPVPGVTVAGAANGTIALSETLAQGAEAAGTAGVRSATASTGREASLNCVAAWPRRGAKGRTWIDFQNDVTAKDVELAARENFVSVEHLKRYTTLGMATDQGKTSNVNGLALMAEITGRRIPEVGTTTYRPPFTPVPFSAFAGVRSGERMNPLRRLPLEGRHRADGAVLHEYGGWLHPAWYGDGPGEERIQREALAARRSVALFDGSTLGKIDVMGPRAAELLDFVHCNKVSELRPGQCGYGMILTETGIVYDDGIMMRLSEDHFIVSCSSSHVAGVYALLEEWRQERFDRSEVVIHNATAETAVLAVSGPRASVLLLDAGIDANLSDGALPPMGLADGTFEGAPVRVARLSFTGERSYEISIATDRVASLWDRIVGVGREHDLVRIGVEALMLLRAEKGYVIIGKDTDGLTRPQDLGFGPVVAGRDGEFLGRRSMSLPESTRPDRKQVVGLAVPDGDAPLVSGAHGVERDGQGVRSIGYVTSSYMSPNLGRPIALALIERGASRHGEAIEIRHLGKTRRATIVPPCAYDPEGSRIHA